MRKVAVLAIATIAVAGFAFGNSITVPFFLDQGDAAFPTQGGATGFIGLVNTSSVDLEMTVIYVSPTGPGNSPENRTPSENTFVINAGATAAYRPGANDPASEGASTVPNMTGFIELDGQAWAAPTEPLAGLAIFYWDNEGNGGADERAIKGRYAQNNQNGSSFSYFLGEGRTN